MPISSSVPVATSSDHTNPRETLLTTLSALQGTIAPAVSRAEVKIKHESGLQVSQEVVSSDDSDDDTAKRATTARLHNTFLPEHRNMRRSGSYNQYKSTTNYLCATCSIINV